MATTFEQELELLQALIAEGNPKIASFGKALGIAGRDYIVFQLVDGTKVAAESGPAAIEFHKKWNTGEITMQRLGNVANPDLIKVASKVFVLR